MNLNTCDYLCLVELCLLGVPRGSPDAPAWQRFMLDLDFQSQRSGNMVRVSLWEQQTENRGRDTSLRLCVC